MQYVLILAETPEDFATRDDPARADAYRDAWMAYAQAIAQAGVLVAGAGLMPPQTATTVRRNGQGVLVEDGPFAETKEQLGGFFVIDVPTVIRRPPPRRAAKKRPHPGATEVRPVLPPRG